MVLNILVLSLKSNAYSFENWLWLFKKIQARILLRVHRWLPRGDRLVLLQSVLNRIPVYWASNAKIPIGFLTKIRKVCFQFLCSRHKEVEGIPLVKWPRIAMPKDLGSWGIKNIYWFWKALATKSLWRLIHNTMLWGVQLCYLSIYLACPLLIGLACQGSLWQKFNNMESDGQCFSSTH